MATVGHKSLVMPADFLGRKGSEQVVSVHCELICDMSLWVGCLLEWFVFRSTLLCVCVHVCACESLHCKQVLVCVPPPTGNWLSFNLLEPSMTDED